MRSSMAPPLAAAGPARQVRIPWEAAAAARPLPEWVVRARGAAVGHRSVDRWEAAAAPEAARSAATVAVLAVGSAEASVAGARWVVGAASPRILRAPAPTCRG